ncbi:helix-turn-helix domain-containing protein [Salinispora cortesiana]|uniref:helix-turn-helix domain-containing protein n=1 Tax=Salinispora cortesiana TaxID=1305843 RepID=UPI0003F74FF8|nr:helix-turn-helix domain-containing protein [Salinispora cortesiana]
MKPLIDKHELAELLRVEVSWVEKATTARTVPITWVGKHARFDLDDLEAWLKGNKEYPDAAPVLKMIAAARKPAPSPSRPPKAPRPPAGPIKPKPPAGPRRTEGRAA